MTETANSNETYFKLLEQQKFAADDLDYTIPYLSNTTPTTLPIWLLLTVAGLLR